MTISELKTEVYSLAHLPIAQTDALFISSLRRALVRIHAELGITEVKRLYVSSVKPSVKIPKLVHRIGETKSLPLTGRAYSLRVSGKGYFTVKDGYDSLRYDFDSSDALFRGFIKVGGEISFCGEYGYTVFDLAMYNEICGDGTDDIPDGSSAVTLDLSERFDFLCARALPANEDGAVIKGASIIGNKLVLPSDFSGTVCIKYVRLPKVYGDGDGDAIDISKAHEALLAPLVASLILIDDDAVLSEKYEKMYTDMKKELSALFISSACERVLTNGWA